MLGIISVKVSHIKLTLMYCFIPNHITYKELGFRDIIFLMLQKQQRTAAQLGSEPGSSRLAPGVPHHISCLCTSLTFFFPNNSFSPAVRLLPFEMSEQNLHCVTMIWLWQLFDQVLHSRDTLSWFLF